jgi:hypothetical protein
VLLSTLFIISPGNLKADSGQIDQIEALSAQAKENQGKECRNPALMGILQIPDPEKHLREHLTAKSEKMKSVIKVGGKEVGELYGTMSFRVAFAQSDDTLKGALIYSLSEEARQKMAGIVGKDLSEIPSTVVIRPDAVAEFDLKSLCPKIILKFKNTISEMMNVELHFSRFKLTLIESSQESSQLMCSYIKDLSRDRSHPARRYFPRINILISN